MRGAWLSCDHFDNRLFGKYNYSEGDATAFVVNHYSCATNQRIRTVRIIDIGTTNISILFLTLSRSARRPSKSHPELLQRNRRTG